MAAALDVVGLEHSSGGEEAVAQVRGDRKIGDAQFEEEIVV